MGSVYVCVEMTYLILFMTQRKVNEHLSNSVSPTESFLKPLSTSGLSSVHCVTLGKSFTFSILDSEGVGSRGNGGPFFVINILQEMKRLMISVLVIDYGKTATVPQC